MKDFYPKGTGNSRYLKSSIPSSITHEELVSMLREGTFPIDLNGINPDGVAQQGTPLNKATLLTDATAALFGLPATAVPDDMFGILAKTGDLHVWRRTQDGVTDYPVHPNRNAYQEGTVGDTTIEYLGQVGSFGGKASIVTGSYVGNGKDYGDGYTNTLTFDGEPYLVIVFQSTMVRFDGYVGLFLNGMAEGENFLSTHPLLGNTRSLSVNFQGSTLRWRASGPQYQLNMEGDIYKYVAIF